MTNRDPDFELLLVISTHNEDAFSLLIERHQEWALRLCFRFLQNWEDAEEVAQDSFLKLTKQANTFKRKSRFRTWFYRVIANTCYDFLRRKAARQKKESQKRKDETDPLTYLVEKETPRDKAAFQDIKQYLEYGISLLPPKQRVCFIGHYLEEKSIREMADLFQLSEGAVKASLFQARRKIKTFMKEIENERPSI